MAQQVNDDAEGGSNGHEALSRRGNGPRCLLTPEAETAVVAALKRGRMMKQAASAAGVAPSTLRGWLQRGQVDAEAGEETAYSSLLALVTRAEDSHLDACLDAVMKAAEDDWRAPAWLLERRHGFVNPARLQVSGTVEHDHRHRLELSVISDAVQRVKDADVVPAGLLTDGSNGADSGPDAEGVTPSSVENSGHKDKI